MGETSPSWGFGGQVLGLWGSAARLELAPFAARNAKKSLRFKVDVLRLQSATLKMRGRVGCHGNHGGPGNPGSCGYAHRVRHCGCSGASGSGSELRRKIPQPSPVSAQCLPVMGLSLRAEAPLLVALDRMQTPKYREPNCFGMRRLKCDSVCLIIAWNRRHKLESPLIG